MTLDQATVWELDPAVADLDFATDPLEGDEYHLLLADLRTRHRVAPVRVFGQQAWLVLGFHELKDFCRRDAEFPGGAAYALNTEPVVGRTFMSMEGSDHDIYRQLATPAFRSRPVTRFVETDLEPLVHEVVDRFAAQGEGDLVDLLTGVLPFLTISRKLGLPYGSEEDQRRWSRDMLALTWDPERARNAAEEFTAIVLPMLEERRRRPTDDVLTHLLTAEYKGVRLDDDAGRARQPAVDAASPTGGPAAGRDRSVTRAASGSRAAALRAAGAHEPADVDRPRAHR